MRGEGFEVGGGLVSESVTARTELANKGCEQAIQTSKRRFKSAGGFEVIQQRHRNPVTSQVTVSQRALSLLTLTLATLLLSCHCCVPHLQVILIATISSVWVCGTGSWRRSRWLRRGDCCGGIAGRLSLVPVGIVVASLTSLCSSTLESC